MLDFRIWEWKCDFPGQFEQTRRIPVDETGATFGVGERRTESLETASECSTDSNLKNFFVRSTGPTAAVPSDSRKLKSGFPNSQTLKDMIKTNPFSQTPPFTRERAAIHEAGHYVLCKDCGFRSAVITIFDVGDDAWEGRTLPNSEGTPDEKQDELIAYGGVAAEVINQVREEFNDDQELLTKMKEWFAQQYKSKFHSMGKAIAVDACRMPQNDLQIAIHYGDGLPKADKLAEAAENLLRSWNELKSIAADLMEHTTQFFDTTETVSSEE